MIKPLKSWTPWIKPLELWRMWMPLDSWLAKSLTWKRPNIGLKVQICTCVNYTKFNYDLD